MKAALYDAIKEQGILEEVQTRRRELCMFRGLVEGKLQKKNCSQRIRNSSCYSGIAGRNYCSDEMTTANCLLAGIRT